MTIKNQNTMRQLLLFVSFAFLFVNNHAISQDTLIHQGSEWKYFAKDSVPEFYWMVNNYPDQDWRKGRAPFGYGNGTEETVLITGENIETRHITEYFRKSFYIENPAEYYVYLLKILRDDGAVIYINGREIWRTNMPEGMITDSTFAATTISVEEETTFYEIVLSPNYFRKGMNTISVSIHQSRLTSTDCSFDLELIRHNDLFSLNQHLRTVSMGEQFFNKSFSLLSMQFELENKNNEINHLKMSNESLKNYTLFIAFFFVILLVVLFYITLKGLKKSNKLENEIQQINNELSLKNKEIVNYAFNSVKLKRFIKSIKDELIGFSKNIPKDDLLTFDRILTKLSFYEDNEEEWERLKSHFDLIHSGFFSKLKSKCPLLTQTELEHCSFIKLQLPTKEIARMLNIDPKSVQASRYRIKKKMGLPLEADLRDVIEKF